MSALSYCKPSILAKKSTPHPVSREWTLKLRCGAGLFSEQAAYQLAHSDAAPLRQLGQHLHQFLVDFDFIAPTFEVGFHGDSFKAVRVICGVVMVPELRSVFVVRKLFGQWINLLLLVVHNSLVPNLSCCGLRLAMQPRVPCE